MNDSPVERNKQQISDRETLHLLTFTRAHKSIKKSHQSSQFVCVVTAIVFTEKKNSVNHKTIFNKLFDEVKIVLKYYEILMFSCCVYVSVCLSAMDTYV